MTESSATSTEEESGHLWGVSERRSRKSGYSNIFSGVNIQQLQRLFQTAGDNDAENRARLVWRGEDDEGDAQHTDGAKGAEGTEEEEAGLAQALVGLRICARTKAGLRAEGPTREHKWYRTSPHTATKQPFSGYSVMEEDIQAVTHDLPYLNEKISGNPNKAPSWKFGVARHENARDSERYLHRILH